MCQTTSSADGPFKQVPARHRQPMPLNLNYPEHMSSSSLKSRVLNAKKCPTGSAKAAADPAPSRKTAGLAQGHVIRFSSLPLSTLVRGEGSPDSLLSCVHWFRLCVRLGSPGPRGCGTGAGRRALAARGARLWAPGGERGAPAGQGATPRRQRTTRRPRGCPAACCPCEARVVPQRGWRDSERRRRRG